ncbi:MAG: hypothetical protein ACLTZF_14260 [Oscillospiraceae bacterium]
MFCGQTHPSTEQGGDNFVTRLAYFALLKTISALFCRDFYSSTLLPLPLASAASSSAAAAAIIPMHEVMATYYERQLTALDRTTERHKAQIKLSAQQGA